jgi:uncharacterized protein YggE
MLGVNQSIRDPLGVTVYGSALLRTDPDIAEAWIQIGRTAKQPAEALEETRKAVRAVRDALAEAHVQAEAIETSRVTVEDAYEMVVANRKRIGYRASVTFRIRIHDVDLVEAVLVGAVAAGANHIHRVSYQTSKLRELRQQARRNAVAAAREKAEAYCDAAGCRLGAVVHIEDVNPDTANVATRSHASVPGDSDGPDDGNSLGSGSLTVAAAVMIVYSLLPPT